MAKWSFDFSGVEDKNFDVTKGRYLVEVKKIEKKDSKSSEYPYLEWTLGIVGGQFNGTNLLYRTSFSPKALFNLRNALISLGLNVPKAAISFDPAKLIGRRMCVDVIVSPSTSGDGKEYPEVKKTLPESALAAETIIPQQTYMAEPEPTVMGDATDVMVMTDEDLPF